MHQGLTYSAERQAQVVNLADFYAGADNARQDQIIESFCYYMRYYFSEITGFYNPDTTLLGRRRIEAAIIGVERPGEISGLLFDLQVNLVIYSLLRDENAGPKAAITRRIQELLSAEHGAALSMITELKPADPQQWHITRAIKSVTMFRADGAGDYKFRVYCQTPQKLYDVVRLLAQTSRIIDVSLKKSGRLDIDADSAPMSNAVLLAYLRALHVALPADGDITVNLSEAKRQPVLFTRVDIGLICGHLPQMMADNPDVQYTLQNIPDLHQAPVAAPAMAP
jgi:hypothetical protein